MDVQPGNRLKLGQAFYQLRAGQNAPLRRLEEVLYGILAHGFQLCGDTLRTGLSTTERSGDDGDDGDDRFHGILHA